MNKKTALIFLLSSVGLVLFYNLTYFVELCHNRDVAGCVYNTLDVLRGKGWYFSTGGTKPPGINFIILAAFKLFGQSFKSIYLTAFFFDVLSLVSIYLLAKGILSKETKLYYLLPAFFALFFVSEPLQTFAANTEVFAMPFEVGGMLFLGLGQYILSGLLLGIGFLIRQLSVLNFLAGLLFILCAQRIDKKPFKNIIKDIVLFTGSFALPFVLVSMYFLYLGVFDRFINYTFIYNLRSAGTYLVNIRHKDLLRTQEILWYNLKFEILFFGILCLLGLWRSFFLRTKTRILISAWFIVICAGLLITAVYQHHFIQLIAPLSCMSLLGFSDVFDFIGAVFKNSVYLKRTLTAVLISLLIIAPIHLVGAVFLNQRRINSHQDVNMIPDRLAAATYIKEHSTPKDEIFVWDDLNTGAITLWSGRDNVGNFHEKYAFLPARLREYWIPYAEDYRLNQRKIIFDLTKDKPKYIVFVWGYNEDISSENIIKSHATHNLGLDFLRQAFEYEREAFPEFFSILQNNYTLEKKINSCRIYRLR